MSAAAATRRTLAPLAIITAAAFFFALLLLLVRLQWAPLESIDHRAAAGLNSLVAGHPAVVSVVEAITWLGSSADLKPAEPAPETTMHHDRARRYGRIAAGVVVTWVLIVGALTGIGKLIMITHNANGNLLGDHTIPHWFAALWLTAVTMLIKPAKDGLDRAGRRPLGLPRRKDVDLSREAAPATR
jgi:hypothetical protein